MKVHYIQKGMKFGYRLEYASSEAKVMFSTFSSFYCMEMVFSFVVKLDNSHPCLK